MSELIAGKIQTGISATSSHNFQLDASAADGTMVLKRADGSTILSVDAAGVVDIAGSGKLYGVDNILGTVSQVAGVPTGAIIEQGSNANGEYVKFADGTLICKQDLIYYAGLDGGTAIGVTWTFPSTFISDPVVTPTCIASTASAAARYVRAGMDSNDILMPSQCEIGIYNTHTGSITSGVNAIAIGRWF